MKKRANEDEEETVERRKEDAVRKMKKRANEDEEETVERRKEDAR